MKLQLYTGSEEFLANGEPAGEDDTLVLNTAASETLMDVTSQAVERAKIRASKRRRARNQISS